MRRTEIFRKQHSDILSHMTKIKPLLREEEFNKDIFINSNAVLVLIGRITAHIIIEDKTIYSDALGHENVDVQSAAKKLNNEMENMREMFNNYRNRWKNLDAIKKDISSFLKESKIFFKCLSGLIEKEEYELCTLIDNI